MTGMTWALFDYGVGNLHSLRKALEAAGADPKVTTDPADLDRAAVAVLPGVGAFGAVMESLEPARGILADRHRDGRPILGVCIGSQVLHDSSEESPGVRGLGLIPGAVERIPASAGKVPHMGWNQLEAAREHPVLDGLDGEAFYFVHSYYPEPSERSDLLGTAEYGARFCAAAGRENLAAVQFHPEKSSSAGLRLYENFLKWARTS
jgi:glutamine amidotransferase